MSTSLSDRRRSPQLLGLGEAGSVPHQPTEVDLDTDTDRVVRGSAWLLGGRVFAVGVALATQVILVRELTKPQFGIWAFGLAVAVGVQIVVSLGHNRVISRFFTIYRERRDAARLLGTLLTEFVVMSTLGALGVLGVAGWSVLAEGAASSKAIVVLSVVAPLTALEELLENLFAAFGKVITIVVRQHVLIPVIRLLIVGGLAIAGVDLVWLAAGYVSVSVISLSFYTAMLWRLLQTEPLFDGWRRQRVRFPATEVFRFSLPMLSGELVYLVNGAVNVALLGLVKGSVSVGALRAIMPFAEANQLVRRQFFRLFVPLASALQERGDRAVLLDAYWRTASWVAVLTFPLYCLTGIFAEPLTTTLLGSGYASSANYLTVLASAYYIHAAVGFNAELLHAVARLRYVTGVNLTTAAVALGGSLAMIPSLGPLGVAVATALSLVVQNALNQWGLRRHLGSALPHPTYRRVYLLVVVASGVLGGLVSLVPGLFTACALSAFASLIVFGLCAPALRPTQSFPELLRLPFMRSRSRS